MYWTQSSSIGLDDFNKYSSLMFEIYDFIEMKKEQKQWLKIIVDPTIRAFY